VHGTLCAVKIGGSYMVEAFVVTTKAPHYVFAAPLGTQPHPVGPAMTNPAPASGADPPPA